MVTCSKYLLDFSLRAANGNMQIVQTLSLPQEGLDNL